MSPEQRPGRVLTRLLIRSCAYCERSFESRRDDHRFCSAKCRSLGFHAEREQARTERDAQLRLKLHEALTLLEEADLASTTVLREFGLGAGCALDKTDRS
ncbi:hypothetical protein AYO43_09235 [Nitrospira sp. SCGC AG-212-E16]|nr:hypothetical protein AYO43_09235 [Nitrospira sp. SCGC AG-212-E16]